MKKSTREKVQGFMYGMGITAFLIVALTADTETATMTEWFLLEAKLAALPFTACVISKIILTIDKVRRYEARLRRYEAEKAEKEAKRRRQEQFDRWYNIDLRKDYYQNSPSSTVIKIPDFVNGSNSKRKSM